MQHFHYKNTHLYCDAISLAEIAKTFGTPCYVYSADALQDNWLAFDNAFKGVPHRVCYAVKANSTLAILHEFAKKGAGFDIVSQGELERVLAVSGNPKNIVFSGVGKQTPEIIRAMEAGIGCFDVESLSELERLHDIATQRKQIANIALRVNPDIDAKTHPFISTGMSVNKFGIHYHDILPICQLIKKMPFIELIGIACHIGSQITDLQPFLDASERMLSLFHDIKQEGVVLKHINVGGGLGVPYHEEKPPTLQAYAMALRNKFKDQNVELIIEPGRALVANAGILLTRVEYIKQTNDKNFAIVDAGMNDFIRPALYDAWHDVLPVDLHYENSYVYDIVGPVCETADVFAKSRQIALQAGDLLAIKTTGAYGFCMSSNYNSRPRSAEVMVKNGKSYLIRDRETIRDLFAGERVC